jgi:hypothetical protein
LKYTDICGIDTSTTPNLNMLDAEVLTIKRQRAQGKTCSVCPLRKRCFSSGMYYFTYFNIDKCINTIANWVETIPPTTEDLEKEWLA